MEPCNDQHISNGNNNLYIHTNIIRLCNNGNNGYYHQWKCNTNFHPGGTTMPERHSTCIANNIKQ